jgi:hypothetical protein
MGDCFTAARYDFSHKRQKNLLFFYLFFLLPVASASGRSHPSANIAAFKGFFSKKPEKIAAGDKSHWAKARAARPLHRRYKGLLLFYYRNRKAGFLNPDAKATTP